MSIMVLPKEIRGVIFDGLGKGDLISCLKVCKAWQGHIQGEQQQFLTKLQERGISYIWHEHPDHPWMTPPQMATPKQHYFNRIS